MELELFLFPCISGTQKSSSVRFLFLFLKHATGLESESILYLYYLDNNAPVYFWSKSFEPKKHEKDALIYKLVLFDLIKIIHTA